MNEPDAIDKEYLASLPGSNNAAFKRVLRIDADWYSIVESACAHYAKGGDLDEVTTTVITDLGKSAVNPSNKLAQAIKKLKEAGLPPEQTRTQMVRLIWTAAKLRARRFSRRSKLQTLPSLFKNDEEQIEVEDTHSDDDEQALHDLKALVLQELTKTANESTNAQTRQRLGLAVKVAEVRMANPPECPSLAELMQTFPDVTKSTMYRILTDIQEAVKRVTDQR